MDKLVLAYSGGLDTSVILKWLCGKFDVIWFDAFFVSLRFESLFNKTLPVMIF